MRPPVATCKQCGGSVPTKPHGPLPMYCGRGCTRAASRDVTLRYNRIYRAAHRAEAAAYMKDRSSEPQFKLARLLRKRVGRAISRDRRAGSAVKDLGCTVVELKSHLEAKFQPGMAWENWSPNGWHIDHIKPLASFDLTDREQFLKACHYTNLQPLWRAENQSKGDRY